MLQQEYDGKIAVLTSSLNDAHAEIEVYKQRKAEYEENMKKAFMRGVCALNMEAMSMWKVGDEDGTAAMLQMPENFNVAGAMAAPQGMPLPPRNRPTAAKMTTTGGGGSGSSSISNAAQYTSAAPGVRRTISGAGAARSGTASVAGSSRSTRKPAVMVERHGFTVVP